MSIKRKIIFIIVGIIYIGFFTSYLYIPESSNYLWSELNQPYTISAGKSITIISWTYSETQGSMEVEISVNDSGFDNEKLEYYVVSRSGNFSKKKEVLYSIVIDTAYYKVLHFSEIDKNFKEISFSIFSEKNSSELRLYSNIRDIEKVEQIEPLTYEGYQRRRLEKVIQAKKTEIRVLRNSIAECNTKLISIDAKNKELESQKTFSTRSEIYDIDQEIANNERLKEDTESQIIELETMIVKLEDEIKEIEETLDN